MHNAAKLILYAQLSLLCALLVCVLLIPHFLFEVDEGGVSNYGTYAKTIIPYSLGLGICGVLTTFAARSVSTKVSHKLLKPTLHVLSVLYLLELLSTYFYKRSGALNSIHVYISMTGAVYCTVLSTWLTISVARNKLNGLLLGVQYAGFLAAGLTYFEHWNIIFVVEAVTAVTFGAILVRSVNEYLYENAIVSDVEST